jgi:hypothetical protein
MKVLVEYFGLFIFAFVILIGGLVALPDLGPAPETTLREVVGLGLAFLVITGGFSWYYFATSPADLTGRGGPGRQSPSREPRRE